MIDIIETYFSRILDEILAWLKLRKNLLQGTAKVLLILSLAFISANPWYSFQKLFDILAWKNGYISFAIGYALIVFVFIPIYRLRNTETFDSAPVLLYYWVPLSLVVSYIVKHGTFKIEEVAREFQVSRLVVNNMLSHIDTLPIFVRGKNNARVLDISLSESDITAYINPNKKVDTDESME